GFFALPFFVALSFPLPFAVAFFVGLVGFVCFGFFSLLGGASSTASSSSRFGSIATQTTPPLPGPMRTTISTPFCCMKRIVGSSSIDEARTELSVAFEAMSRAVDDRLAILLPASRRPKLEAIRRQIAEAAETGPLFLPPDHPNTVPLDQCEK